MEPAAGVAVRVTAAPLVKLAAQVAPQLIPAGLLVTVPVPAPAGVTVNTKVGAKVAVTVVAAEIVTVQAPVPVHPPPLQPVKVEPAAGVGVGVNAAARGQRAGEVPPHIRAAGLVVLAPRPAAPQRSRRGEGWGGVWVAMVVAAVHE